MYTRMDSFQNPILRGVVSRTQASPLVAIFTVMEEEKKHGHFTPTPAKKKSCEGRPGNEARYEASLRQNSVIVP